MPSLHSGHRSVVESQLPTKSKQLLFCVTVNQKSWRAYSVNTRAATIFIYHSKVLAVLHTCQYCVGCHRTSIASGYSQRVFQGHRCWSVFQREFYFATRIQALVQCWIVCCRQNLANEAASKIQAVRISRVASMLELAIGQLLCGLELVEYRSQDCGIAILQPR